ncbi:lipoprotein insertase outer membrane protein LolB [Alkalilimnicola sp. S0819]|uniref:lipoprotein insertase outer membrane protein LolB n=1 Tax=Alkalilimnicola sp. S0819 TaxID=2613922 RepID=UPI0012615781|nr:lipoprotein insertase outer membrane protein LolB [Alkalilimnicola sp. S0819]KAB7623785.1 outer membrane lipoprotein LolB [Alkalilimnicola sp. S0819]MPQ16658.1 outer membrane lipoprotein LolB [Alkalilimnicola sp. S0819]
MKCWLTVLLAALLLVGCATRPPQEDVRGDREQALLAVEQWSLSGRAVLRAPRESGRFSVAWRQDGAAYDIWLRAPLGAGSLHLRGEPGRASLQTRDRILRAASPAQLLAAYLPAPLPVEALGYWLRGLPQPGGGARLQRDEDGLPRALAQGAWEVEYRRYVSVGGFLLPEVLHLRGPDVELRLAVNEWVLDGRP